MLQLGKGGAFPSAPFAEIRRKEGLCTQVVLTGDDIDLCKFAFIQSNPADSLRYVNTGSVFTNDAQLRKIRDLSMRNQGTANARYQPQRGSRCLASVHGRKSTWRKIGPSLDRTRVRFRHMGGIQIDTES
ncbi:MAG: UbiD family decarboxylase [Gammaproteobacteria bacterium]|nr:UbiD family decarboxylase [Gammaproteobacteria bacterium]